MFFESDEREMKHFIDSSVLTKIMLIYSYEFDLNMSSYCIYRTANVTSCKYYSLPISNAEEIEIMNKV